MPELPDVEAFRKHTEKYALHKKISRLEYLDSEQILKSSEQKIGKSLYPCMEVCKGSYGWPSTMGPGHWKCRVITCFLIEKKEKIAPNAGLKLKKSKSTEEEPIFVRIVRHFR